MPYEQRGPHLGRHHMGLGSSFGKAPIPLHQLKQRLACSEHPGMQATLVAADGPLATLSDDRGQFGFSGVPPGAYRLLVTFEGRTVEQAVTVTSPRTEVRVQ